jgi:Lrp/AsnC family transcriptional regulator, regulator for asnA, asnC and gidA
MWKNIRKRQVIYIRMELLTKMTKNITDGKVKLDKEDKLILAYLEGQADITTKKLASILKMPQTTVHNKIKRLKTSGLIKRYVAILDYSKLNKPLTAYVLINADYTKNDEVSEALTKLPSVTEVVSVAGANDLLVKVRVVDANELGDLVLRNFKRLPGVTRTETMLVLEEFK